MSLTLFSFLSFVVCHRESDVKDDSDDDIGPKPLPAGAQLGERDAAAEFREREERRRKAAEVRARCQSRGGWALTPKAGGEQAEKARA